MTYKNVNDFFKKIKNEMMDLNDEYEQMKKSNKEKSSSIKESIEQKIKNRN